MKWETVVISKPLTIDMGILETTGTYVVRVFLDRTDPLPMMWKPTYGRVIEESYDIESVPTILKLMIDSIPER